AAFPRPYDIGDPQRASRRTMHEGDYVTNTTYGIIRGKELTHGCMRGLQLRNHLAPFDLLDELLQGPVKNDVVVVVVVHVFYRSFSCSYSV
ncbi:MAG: hypothetical protein ACXWET_07005, partial [Halobacteriota archaeon]